ncbi:unnamed protein product, partial [Choristocarpus tenellus]
RPLSVSGFIQFILQLGDISMPVQAVVIPNLGVDKILLDNSIMSAFGAVLDWDREEMSFKDSDQCIPAKDKIVPLPICSPPKDFCQTETASHASISVITSEFNTPLHTVKKILLPPGTETLVPVCSQALRGTATDAVVEPIIYTGTDLQHENDIHPHWQ